MAKLTVLSTVNHDGVYYAPGDTLDVKDKAQIAELIEAGVCADPKAVPADGGDGGEQG